MKSRAFFRRSKDRSQLVAGLHTSALNSMDGSRWGPHLWVGALYFCADMHAYNRWGLVLHMLSTIQPLKQTLILFGVSAHAGVHTHLHKTLFTNGKAIIFTIYPCQGFWYTSPNVIFHREQIFKNSGLVLFIKKKTIVFVVVWFYIYNSYFKTRIVL